MKVEKTVTREEEEEEELGGRRSVPGKMALLRDSFFVNIW